MAGPRHQAGRLRQQCRFADAGIAAHKKHRAPDKTAAGDAIELGHPGAKARGLMALAGEALHDEFSPLALGADRDRHRGGAGDIFLNQRIPLAAGLALALPAVIRGAAVLADEGKGGFGHEMESLIEVTTSRSIARKSCALYFLFLFCSYARVLACFDPQWPVFIGTQFG